MRFGGVIALQLACLGWALGTSYTKRHPSSGDPLAASTVQMLFSGAMLLGSRRRTTSGAALHFTPRTLGAMIYLTVAGSVVAYTAYVYAVRHLPISTVSLYAYINPLIAVALGSLLLGEPFSIRILVAAGLVLAGIAVVRGVQSPVPRLPRLAALTPDSAGWGFFLCTTKEVRTGRSGSDFLILTLQDVSAQLTAKIFDEVERFDAEFEAGEFVQGRRQGQLLQRPGAAGAVVDPPRERRAGSAGGLPRGRLRPERAAADRRDVGGAAAARVAAMENAHLRVLLHAHPDRPRAQLREWPAAQVIHHAYRGGFLEHIVKMAEVGEPSPVPTAPTRTSCSPASSCTTSASCRSWPTTRAPPATRATATCSATSRSA